MRTKKLTTVTKSTKRPRTPVACDRCKLRKQRCDGVTPSCSSCTKAKSRCVYSRSFITGPSADVSKYIQTLENEVAVLRKTALLSQEPSVSRNKIYIGETTSGGMIMKVMQKQLKTDLQDPGLFEMQSESNLSSVEPVILKSNNATVQRYINVYYKRCHYKYPALNRQYFDDLIRTRPNFEDFDHWDAFLVHVVIAIAARCVELSEGSAEYNCDGLYAVARMRFNQCSPTLLQYIEALTLCGLYTFQSATLAQPNSWQLVGKAMRAAVEVGLHRKQPVMRDKDPLALLEFEKRLFWSIYSLDRRLSLMLGRPYAIPDEDIDVQLPIDVDESVTDTATLYQLRVTQESERPQQSSLSNLSCMITNCKLRRLESCIKRRIYSREYTNQSVDELKQELEQWFDNWPSRDVIDRSGVFYEPVDYMMLNYYRAKKLLLDPAFHKLEPDLAHMFPLFYEYVQSLEGICHTYKLLEQNGLLCYTPDGVAMLFYTGLSLMYCLSLDKQGSVTVSAIAHIKVCSNLLHSYGERWPAAKKCRAVFDELVDIVATPRERVLPKQERADPDVLRPDLWEVPLWDHNPF
ncbi:hypothetical protein TRVA0_039S01002 [Trichomonascus vanleenenianus]|uniref:uncharacterized protein n=1 Tax=Trichomonascus vanleenenianus TaxID=2268995 RepID=UPI003ECB4C18